WGVMSKFDTVSDNEKSTNLEKMQKEFKANIDAMTAAHTVKMEQLLKFQNHNFADTVSELDTEQVKDLQGEINSDKYLQEVTQYLKEKMAELDEKMAELDEKMAELEKYTQNFADTVSELYTGQVYNESQITEDFE
ncbi:MAG: prefoldin subunit 5, partial [Candidatus Midichloriaceae bacterium]